MHILHHGRCFDGAASAALFAAFARAQLSPELDLRFLPKHHRRGNPFDTEDFACDWAACVDFRYSQNPRLTWFFDHHRSAFSEPGDRAHFDADTSGQKFHDPLASSCAKMIATLTHRYFGFDPGPHKELIEWADIIDAARFPDPQSAVDLQRPPMKLAAYIQSESEAGKIEQFIEDLLRVPLTKLANAAYLQPILAQKASEHQDNIDQVKRRSTLSQGVVLYDLLDQPSRILNHFIPYHLYPDARYAVGAYRHRDQSLRISAGFNPWCPGAKREHDLASLCEPHGGGGHPYVAGCSFAEHEQDAAQDALLGIYRSLQATPPKQC